MKSDFSASKPHRCNSAGNKHGFTLQELVLVLAMASVLSAITLSAVSHGQVKSQVLTCMENFNKLTTGWLSYAYDNNGVLINNYLGSQAQGGSKRGGWASGWLDWTTSTDNTNALFMMDDRWSPLAVYVNHDRTVFKCPSDNYLSRPQVARGWTERARSYSMNSCMGEGTYKNFYGSAQTIYAKLSDIKKLPLAKAFVFVEEHPESINDPCFIVNVLDASWLDLPASFHKNSCMFSFADGHVELKRWLDARTVQPVKYTVYTAPTAVGSVDYLWLKERTTEPW